MFKASSGLLAIAGLTACLMLAVPALRAANFTVNPQRLDSYRNYRFRVLWDGQYIAGISKVSPLIRRTEVTEYREGGNSTTTRHLPGRTQYDAITLERGLTHDTLFENWANSVAHFGASVAPQVTAANFNKELEIEVYNTTGQLTTAYKLHRCWPSEYMALSALDAGASAAVIQRLVLQCESWERRAGS